MHKQLNMDMWKAVSIDTDDMEWTPSPASGVERRQLEREAAESGHTTSIVRYEPRSHFPAHIHDGGEEFLVLEGVFSDESGDYPEGTYVRNPPLSKHAPFTNTGCTIFVKLCQFQEGDKERIVVDSHANNWSAANIEGIQVQTLHKFKNETIQLEKWAANISRPESHFPDGLEVLILKGEIQAMGERLTKGCWLRRPADSVLSMRSIRPVLLYTKQGHL